MQRLSELAAAQALAIHASKIASADAALRDQIRAALLRWQLSLAGDGRPVRATMPAPGHQAAAASCVARILASGVSYETPVIVSDLTRHLDWLWSRRSLPPWGEAALIDAACETALVARETALLRRSRKRLGALLVRQNAQGWWDDARDCRLAEQSLALSALARMYSQTGWPELESALHHGMMFIAPFVQAPRGNLHPLCAIPFYAAESLHGEGAAVVAHAARPVLPTLMSYVAHAGDLDIALTAASLSLAGTVVASQALAAQIESGEQLCGGYLIRRDGRLNAWIDLRRGGGLTAAWPESGTALHDELTVMTSRGAARTRQARGIGAWSEGGKIVCVGEIRLGTGSLLREYAERWRVFPRNHRRLGTHRREVTFEGDSVTIRDHLGLRRHAPAILCGSPGEFGEYPIVIGEVKDMEMHRAYCQGQLVSVRRAVS